MVGGLPIMGLNSDWDDSAQANDKVAALNKPWGNYSKTPARGVNLGGWLSIEPFITPSLFNYPLSAGVVDEWTLCAHLGSQAASTIENHYNTFVTESTFQDIANAGLDHVRIPFHIGPSRSMTVTSTSTELLGDIFYAVSNGPESMAFGSISTCMACPVAKTDGTIVVGRARSAGSMARTAT